MKQFLTAAGLAIVASACQAQGYVGAGVGASNHSVDCADTSKCDRSDVGYKLYGGYKLNPVVSAELAYVDFGKSKYTYTGQNVDIKASAVVLAAAARYEFSPGFSGVGRFGVANVSAEANGPANSVSTTKAKLYYGLGLDYAIKRDLKAVFFADFTKATLKSNGTSDSGSIRLVGLAIQKDF